MMCNPMKVLAFIIIVLAWIFLTFFFIGCANTTYKTIPNAMSEDAQDYPTKYNLMDSQDGSKNPNAQLDIIKFNY